MQANTKGASCVCDRARHRSALIRLRRRPGPSWGDRVTDDIHIRPAAGALYRWQLPTSFISPYPFGVALFHFFSFFFRLFVFLISGADPPCEEPPARALRALRRYRFFGRHGECASLQYLQIFEISAPETLLSPNFCFLEKRRRHSIFFRNITDEVWVRVSLQHHKWAIFFRGYLRKRFLWIAGGYPRPPHLHRVLLLPCVSSLLQYVTSCTLIHLHVASLAVVVVVVFACSSLSWSWPLSLLQVAMGWFQTLFVYLHAMPRATVRRIWDWWLSSGDFEASVSCILCQLFLSRAQKQPDSSMP